MFEALKAEFFGSMIVALDIAPNIEASGSVVAAATRDIVEHVVRDALRALQTAESRQCDVTLRRSGSQLMLTILSEVGEAEFEAAQISAWAPALEELGGYLAVGVQDGSVAVSPRSHTRLLQVPSASPGRATDSPAADAHAA